MFAKSRIYTVVLTLIVLAGCGTQGKFASVFGKRKYTKGHFWDKAGSGETVRGKTERETTKSPILTSVPFRGRKEEGVALPLFDANEIIVSSPALEKKEKVAITKNIHSTWVGENEEAVKENGNEPANNSPEHTGRILLGIGILLIPFTILLGAFISIPGPVILLIALLVLALIIAGLILSGSKQNSGSEPTAVPAQDKFKPATDDYYNKDAARAQQQGIAVQPTQTSMGIVGFVMALTGLLLLLFTYILLASIPVTTLFGGLILGFFGGLAVISLVIASIISNYAIRHNDKHMRLASLGFTISSVALAILIIYFVASKL
jgi:hypothetical protein